MSSNCLVAMYHYVRDTRQTPYPSLNALSPADFETQLDALARTRRIVEYAEFEHAVAGRHSFTTPTALLTFDDGFVDHHDVVMPRLQARGVSGVFFLAGAPLGEPPCVLSVHKIHFLIATLGVAPFAAALHHRLQARPVAAAAGLEKRAEVYRYDVAPRDVEVKHLLNYELPHETADEVLSALFTQHLGDEAAFARALYLSPQRIREMAAAGMTFGFHTERHRVLSRLSPVEQWQELARGVSRIRQLTGQQSVPFCYPYGHPHTYDATTIRTLRESGYATAFTTTRRAVDPVSDDAFELPRFDTRDLPPFTGSFPDV